MVTFNIGYINCLSTIQKTSSNEETKMTEEKIDFTKRLAEIKKENGIVTKTRENSNSKFAIIRRILMENNESRDEAVYKILKDLKENDVDVTADYKKIMALMGNFLTYVRKSYKGYEGYELIDSAECFKVIVKE